LIDDILTTAQAARLLGVSTRTAQLWVEQGALPHWKTPGGHRRIRRADVQALLGATASPTTEGDDIPPGHAFPVAPNERERLAAVRRSGLVGTSPEPSFDHLTWLASRTLKAPISLFTILTPTTQWFKSRQGLDVADTPREWAFCNYTVMAQELLVIPDLTADERFVANPAVHGAPGFRFYAGVPMVDAQGYALGSLCVIDTRSRRLSDEQADILRRLASLGSDELRRRAH
jgi:excisionase family DNA binding protein